MLALKRFNKQSIMIGDDICVWVDRCHDGHCRVMIEAPKDIPVHRQEVYDAIKAAEREAARVSEGTASA